MIQIYRLFSESCTSFYVGSTSKDLKWRLSKHRNKSHEAPNRKIYNTILKNGGFDAWKIECLEECDMASRNLREQHFIDTLRPDMNSVRVMK